MILRFEKLATVTYVNTDNVTKIAVTRRDFTVNFVDGLQKEFVIGEDITAEQVKALTEQLDKG